MTTAISLKNLSKTYNNGFEALKGISLDVKAGDFFALLGPNGAGKSTTIGIISTLVRKTSGTVEVFGKNVDIHEVETKLNLGVVPQEVNFSQFEKARDIIITQAGYYGMPRMLASQRAEKYLKKLGLWDKKDTRARNLSGGMKRRLMIARALIHEPKLLILDEPTAGVDIELRRSMWEFLTEINNNGTTIILTTHYLEEAESLCRNIGIINEGRLVENTSMKKLLAELDSQILILDTTGELKNLSRFSRHKVSIKALDDHRLEVCANGGVELNSIFVQLAELGIIVTGLRNKSNRLEQLFLSRLDAPQADDSLVAQAAI